MKRIVIVMIGVGVAVGAGLYLAHPTTPASSSEEAVAEASAPVHATASAQPAEVVGSTESAQDRAPHSWHPPRYEAGREPQQPAPERLIATDPESNFDLMIETLLSPQNDFELKQVAWKRLKETGQLDPAIAELETRAANNPQNADNAATLGEAYLKKAGATEDMRQKAIWAMKADQTLEQALSLDPSNWEARYIKAVGMSYWPAQLNKGQEVIEQFQTLIQQQEAQSPQPQFARSYAWLGDQYQKGGRPDYATQVWQRGAGLFPNNEELRNKLASMPATP